MSAVMPTLNNLVAKLTSRKSGSHVASGACLRLQTSFMDSAQILTGYSSATARPRARRKPTMPTTFEKLNLKSQTRILVLNAPDSFEKELKALRNVQVHRQLEKLKAFDFVLAFATQQAEVARLSKALAAKAEGDAVLWFAYPKGTSKKYQCDFNRDRGWDELRKLGFDTVRQVAIDEDWSALRFRRVQFIKSAQ